MVYLEVGQRLIEEAVHRKLDFLFAGRNFLTCGACFVMETKFQFHWKHITE